MNYLKYFLKIMTGFMIITALDVILKKTDPSVGMWWYYITLILYNGYCYLEYRLTDKD